MEGRYSLPYPNCEPCSLFQLYVITTKNIWLCDSACRRLRSHVRAYYSVHSSKEYREKQKQAQRQVINKTTFQKIGWLFRVDRLTVVRKEQQRKTIRLTNKQSVTRSKDIYIIISIRKPALPSVLITPSYIVGSRMSGGKKRNKKTWKTF